MDARLAHICLPCANPKGTCNGSCPCPQDGRDILIHIREASCPIKKFTVANPIPETPIESIPREQWPAWAKWAAFRGNSTDKGVGDTVARHLGKVGGELFKAAIKAMGADCGCTAKQFEWNQKYPYLQK